jgi:hypothetical protein
MNASVPVADVTQRTWRRKWREVLHDRQSLADAYAEDHLDAEHLNRRVEAFFKTCRELADWIEEATGRPAIAYVKSQPALDLCDAVAQTAKHYTRDPSRGRDSDPITAILVQLYGDETVIHADIEWTKESGADGVVDALDLARRCRDEWREFFQMHDLDPTS